MSKKAVQPSAAGRVFNIDPDIRTWGTEFPVEIATGGGKATTSAPP
jgi:hypothetical protein